MQNGAPMVAQVNGMAQQRSFFLAPIATDQILKRLSVSIATSAATSRFLTPR